MNSTNQGIQCCGCWVTLYSLQTGFRLVYGEKNWPVSILSRDLFGDREQRCGGIPVLAESFWHSPCLRPLPGYPKREAIHNLAIQHWTTQLWNALIFDLEIHVRVCSMTRITESWVACKYLTTGFVVACAPHFRKRIVCMKTRGENIRPICNK